MKATEMTLAEQRCLFSVFIAQLISQAYAQGFNVAFDQIKRTQTEADINAVSGAGIKNSLHLIGLAADLLVYDKNFTYLNDSDIYEFLGTLWKVKHPLCCWGGDFTKPDRGHFSMTRNGIK